MTGTGPVDVEALATAVEQARTRWHAARQARDDALHAFEDAMRAELAAAADYRDAMATYDANKGWRS